MLCANNDAIFSSERRVTIKLSCKGYGIIIRPMSPKVLTSGLLMRQGLKLVGMGAHSLTMNDSCKEHWSVLMRT
jgi:hypothetical protein